MGDDVRARAALAAFDEVDDGVVVMAIADGFPVVEANASFARMAGLAPGSAVGTLLADLQPDPVIAGFARRVDEVLRTGQPTRDHFVHEGPAGRVTLDVTLCHLPDLGDDPAHVLAVLRDVTALLRVNDVLDEVERVTRTGTWTWDVVGDTVRWSSQLYELFGVSRTQMEPSLSGYLQRVHPDDREAVEAAVRATFESGQGFDLHHRVVTPDQEVRRLHCTGRRVDGFDGTPVRMSGTARLVEPTT